MRWLEDRGQESYDKVCEWLWQAPGIWVFVAALLWRKRGVSRSAPVDGRYSFPVRDEGAKR